MDQSIANARLPYAAKPPAPPEPQDPINRILLPSFTGAYIKDAENWTQNALLTTALALHAYRLEHGGYPASLAQLVPAYLANVPDDPFALSEPLRYKPAGKTYVLYSVGPDGVDDGGRPIFDRSKPAPGPGHVSESRYFVLRESKGDVVAGVTVY